VTDYSKTFLDHYRRPRNLGDLEGADAIAIVHDDVCGDVLRLAVTVDRPRALGGDAPTGAEVGFRVREARFKAFGCAATTAVASVLTEMLIGSTEKEIGRLGAADLIDALGGLPPGRVHSAVLGGEALRAVIERLDQCVSE